MSVKRSISPEMVDEARRRIAPFIIRTPAVFSPTFSERCGASVYLKLETLQKAGSFKVRGATNKILANLPQAEQYGVVAASAGNHAQGVAVAAYRAKVPATIVMPSWASPAKKEATRAYGATVVPGGETLEECVERARRFADTGMLFIHPYDDPEVIAGQGTIGSEILEDLPAADAIVAPVGGGGLLAGIATAVKAERPSCQLFGAQSEQCPSMYEALRTGQPCCVVPKPSVADGIRVAEAGKETLPIIRSLVDRIVLVPEDAITDAMLQLIERKKVIAEGAGAVPLAALLSGAIPIRRGSTTVLVISGGNIDIPLMERSVRDALVLRGKILRCTIFIPDVPGALTGLIGVVRGEGGDLLSISPENDGNFPPGERGLRFRLEIETNGSGQAGSITRALEAGGYRPLLLSKPTG